MNENFNSNPNQRKITVNKELTDNENKENYYAKINLIALKNAMNTLTANALQLWLYFSKNQNDYTFYLSKVDFFNWSSIKSPTTYTKIFKELVNYNYLIPIDIENPEPKKYNFYEIPIEQNEIEITINKFESTEDFLY